jgi:hypothetical protein
MIDDYAQDPAPALREQVAGALVNKSVELGVRGRSDEAIEAYQRVIDDYAKTPPHLARAGRPCA